MEYSPLSPEKKFSRIHGHCDTVNCNDCICGNRIDFVMRKHRIAASNFLDEQGRSRTLDTREADLLKKINQEIRDIPRNGEIVCDPDFAEEHVRITRVVPPVLHVGSDDEL